MEPLDVLQLITGVCGIVGLIYKVLKIESAIYKYVDNSVDSIKKQIHLLEKDFAILKNTIEDRREIVDYRLNGLNEKIDHKFRRLHADVKEVQGSLQKHGFIHRDNREVEK